MPTLIEILNWKYPGAIITLYGEKIAQFEHPSFKQPNEIDLEAIRKEYIAYRASILYREQRAPEYPAIGDQLDAIWVVLEKLTTGMPDLPLEFLTVFDAVRAVKEKYPKPENKS